MTRQSQRVVLITGMSGAGRSAGLRILEDLGYEAIDNLPISLLGRLLLPGDVESVDGKKRPLAIDVDIRTRGFGDGAFRDLLKPLRERGDIDVGVVFFDCDDQVLRRRFTETRRRHPLAEDRPLMDGLRHERELLSPLRDSADLLVDTSNLSLPALRDLLSGNFRLDVGSELTLSVTSFAYRRGLPREADLVFDVRFLVNPHYQDELRALTGRDAPVAAYIQKDPAFQPFIERVCELVRSLLPHYEREGKTYFTIAVGCTGGHHRSVYVAERIAEMIAEEGRAVTVRHRDLDAETSALDDDETQGTFDV